VPSKQTRNESEWNQIVMETMDPKGHESVKKIIKKNFSKIH
jgi:hypothetical protein